MQGKMYAWANSLPPFDKSPAEQKAANEAAKAKRQGGGGSGGSSSSGSTKSAGWSRHRKGGKS
jgi:hypothetical protein